MKKILLFFILACLIIPAAAYAKIGVGVGVGKIQVDDKLKPGTIYQLPSLTVINTGDEPSDYEVSVTYHEQQTQLMPSSDWFSFSPRKFHLNPGEVQEIKIKLNLPVMTRPGDYFAYLEGQPTKKAESGQTRIGIAAAAKLYFTVVPGNIFEGLYYKILSFWQVYSPWPQRATILLVIIGIFLVFKKFFNFQINMKRSSKGSGNRQDQPRPKNEPEKKNE